MHEIPLIDENIIDLFFCFFPIPKNSCAAARSVLKKILNFSLDRQRSANKFLEKVVSIFLAFTF